MEEIILPDVCVNTFGELKFENDDISTSSNCSEDLNNAHNIRVYLRQIGFLEKEVDDRDRIIKQLHQKISDLEKKKGVSMNFERVRKETRVSQFSNLEDRKVYINSEGLPQETRVYQFSNLEDRKVYINSERLPEETEVAQLETESNKMDITPEFKFIDETKSNLDDDMDQDNVASPMEAQLSVYSPDVSGYSIDNKMQVEGSSLVNGTGVDTTGSRKTVVEPIRIVHCPRKKKEKGVNSGKPKKVSCLYCKKKFTCTSTLEIHIRIHTGARPYTCPVCKTSFRQRGHLIEHISSWHRYGDSLTMRDPENEGWYEIHLCYFCSIVNRTRGDYKKHISRRHADLLQKNK